MVDQLESMVMPYLNALAVFRDQVRELAIQKKGAHFLDPDVPGSSPLTNIVEHVEFLKLSDRLRDDVLPELGVLLEDRDDQRALIKLESKDELDRRKADKEKVGPKMRCIEIVLTGH